MGGAVAVAIIRRREEEVREDFQRAGALQPATARSLSEIGLDENYIVHRMMKRAVIRESNPGLFYFDEDVWQAVRSMRRRMVIILLIAVALVGIVSLYGVTTFQ